MMRPWQLPEFIEDVLPNQGFALERLRRSFLDTMFAHGYELVMPPLVEFADTFRASGEEMNSRTCKLVDRLSAQTLGVRADMTPQAARIDAHLLNRQGVTRLCYFGSVLHSAPASLMATREPIQFGGELYGHANLEADMEVVGLLEKILIQCALEKTQLELGHVGLFRAFAEYGQWNEELGQEIHAALQDKDRPRLQAACRTLKSEIAQGLMTLLDSHGSVEVLAQAERALPMAKLPALSQALGDLRRMSQAVHQIPLRFDLAEMGSYDYHTGLVFAAYAQGHTEAVAQGGRYDNVGLVFGRARPATGFSMDVRALVPQEATMPTGILSPWPSPPEAQQAIAQLRAQGARVASELPGHGGHWRESGFDRRLVDKSGRWVVEPLKDGE